MVSLIIILLWSIAIILTRHRQQLNKIIIAMTMFIIPTIKIGTSRINSLYYWIVFLALFVFAFRNLKLCINKTQQICLFAQIAVAFTYCLAWAFNGAGNILLGMVGYIKYIPLIYVYFIIFQKTGEDELYVVFRKCFRFTLLINLIFCLAQIIIPSYMAMLMTNIFANDHSIGFADQVASGSLRCYGVYNHPSCLAIFALFSICVNLRLVKRSEKGLIYIIISVLVGIMSLTKTFFIGIIVLLLLFLLTNIKNINNRKVFVVYSISILGGCILYAGFDGIILRVREYSPVLAYYMEFIKKPIEALSTRYSTADGSLNATKTVILKHILLGVGPNPVIGESINDSAPIVIMHNGGLIALLFVLLMYCVLMFKALEMHEMSAFYLIVTILISGFALPIWIFHDISLGVWLFLILVSRKEMIYTENYKYLPREMNDG